MSRSRYYVLYVRYYVLYETVYYGIILVGGGDVMVQWGEGIMKRGIDGELLVNSNFQFLHNAP